MITDLLQWITVSAQHVDAVEAAAHQATGGTVPYKHRKSTFRCVLAVTFKLTAAAFVFVMYELSRLCSQ
jgi:hypothetical protein